MKILLADDQSEVRSALRIILEQQPGLSIVGEAAELQSMLLPIKEKDPDIVLLDWELGNLRAADMIPILKLISPDIRIIALSCRPESTKAALTAGVDAFVCKIDHPEKLLDAIREIGEKNHIL
jgi:DNA-binding NarL/FixJ family response regulator